MKRLVFIIIAIMLILTLVSCAKPQEEVAEFVEPTPVPQETEKPIEEIHVLAEPPYYESFEELVLRSDAILIGTAGKASCKRFSGDRIRTYTEVRINEVFKGNHAENDVITVSQNGGEADGLRMIVKEAGCSVSYLQNETEYLLFLSSRSGQAEKPSQYSPMNSFVIYEIADGTVIPVSSSSAFITRPTPLELVKDQIGNSLLLESPEPEGLEPEMIYGYMASKHFVSLEKLAAASDAILIGTVSEIESRKFSLNEVETDAEIQIKEIIKGSFIENESITVTIWGGEAEGIRFIVEDTDIRIPYLQKDTEYLLFLKNESEEKDSFEYVPITSFEGFFKIKDGMVSPVSFSSKLITMPTPLDEVKEQLKNHLSQTE